jgi:hypothetical protein
MLRKKKVSEHIIWLSYLHFSMTEKPYEPTGNFEKDFKEYTNRLKASVVPLTTDKTFDRKAKIRLHMDPLNPEILASVEITGFALDPPLARVLGSTIMANSLSVLKCVMLHRRHLTSQALGYITYDRSFQLPSCGYPIIKY